MKKLFLLPLAALLSVTAGFISAGAEMTTVSVESYDLTVQLPEDWVYITSETSPSDPVFEQLGIEGKSFLETMKQNRLLIDGITTDMELALSNPSDTNIVQLSSSSDEELADLMEEMGKQDMDKILEDAKSEVNTLASVVDMTVEPLEVYRNGSMTYIISDTKVSYDAAVVYGHQYYTVVNKHVLTFQFNSLTGQKLTDAQKAAAREIMNTVSFGHLDEPASGFSYNWKLIWQEGAKGAVGGGLIGMAAAGIWLLYKKKFRKEKEKEA